MSNKLKIINNNFMIFVNFQEKVANPQAESGKKIIGGM